MRFQFKRRPVRQKKKRNFSPLRRTVRAQGVIGYKNTLPRLEYTKKYSPLTSNVATSCSSCLDNGAQHDTINSNKAFSEFKFPEKREHYTHKTTRSSLADEQVLFFEAGVFQNN